ncbi:Predicted nucleic acid-binding protein, contains PIN domain [Novosphingobium sp. CF614]|uniref:type II toxin-antitoxin system VapC family toxin n=1 Tax=Novosphingobium sp. CF614 TaxID=1884364 RepID=UPI0008E0BE3A|nr:type II toxin-antitoxin system VapC family toxin [Novosphingobium sp. CF614]SFF75490.1 Predicted nucleic acid-binding protein, contains PIN domain [Novosphingobium sp. CF614]
MIVVDASLAVKWYLREALTFKALDILYEHGGGIIVPDLFVSEVTGALVRRANIDKARRPDSEIAIARFMGLFETDALTAIRSAPETLTRAAALAMDLGHPLKDCIYLALAMERECPLVTADAKFAVKAREVWEAVRVLGA